MLDIVTGQKRSVFGIRDMRDVVERLAPNGTLYIGYPIIATADEPIVIEALLTCREYGVVVFDLAPVQPGTPITIIEDRQSDLHIALQQKLLAYRPLRDGRDLSLQITVVTLVPTLDVVTTTVALSDALLVTPERLSAFLVSLPSISDDQLKGVNAAIQRITTMKPANKRPTVTRKDSRGAVMRTVEAEIANLDQWQKRAAIETPDGPQRIRGLAGSGKTIVLALKAAYLHAQNPDWDIAVTFSTRALRQQFEELIRRFCFAHLNDEPNWSKLRILHSWGSSSKHGLYYEIATKNGLPFHDFGSARNTFGYDDAFEGSCDELLKALKKKGTSRQLFDAILIDEAQDLPRSFFELCYRSARAPHRIIYGYDEMQNLSSKSFDSVASPSVLFGKGDDGLPAVQDLHTLPQEPRKDIMLPVCYRNTPWALTTAHAVGFGIYRPEGLVQYFAEQQLWSDVGYVVTSGELELGAHVTLTRGADSSPAYFKQLLDPTDAVRSQVFADTAEQATWLADQIAINLSDDELDLTDILIILSNPLTAREQAAEIIDALNARDIPAHLAGVTASVDRLFQDGSIAITGIYRAKGNEAPMVYIANSGYFARGTGATAIRRRNMLFTAITRSRAWVRVIGTGDSMVRLKNEIDAVSVHHYSLSFQVPTAEELERLRQIQRDMSRRDVGTIRKAERSLDDLVRSIEAGDIDRDDLTPQMRKSISTLLRKSDA